MTKRGKGWSQAARRNRVRGISLRNQTYWTLSTPLTFQRTPRCANTHVLLGTMTLVLVLFCSGGCFPVASLLYFSSSDAYLVSVFTPSRRQCTIVPSWFLSLRRARISGRSQSLHRLGLEILSTLFSPPCHSSLSTCLLILPFTGLQRR